jgi:hypothetical protein
MPDLIVYVKTALTGGGGSALDGINGAVLNDGDVAQVRTSENILYDYSLDADSGAAESSPDVIAPDTNPGNKRWMLQKLQTGAITTASIIAPANSLIIRPTTDATTAIQIADKDGNAIQTINTTDNHTIFNGSRSDTPGACSLIVFAVSKAGIRMTTGNAIAIDYFDGATWSNPVTIGDIGAVTMPLQPAFLARPTAVQTNIAVGSVVTVVFGTEIFDQNADFATNTFTAPVTGKYQLSVYIALMNIDTASAYYVLRICTSNRNYDIDLSSNAFGADVAYTPLSAHVLADMDAGDTAYIAIVQEGGTQQTDIGTSSYFSGHLVC